MKTFCDKAYIEMAYGLAEKAKGWTSPNPCVGAVIVKDGKIAGAGYHERPGLPHAEIIALNQAGSKARNATAYFTLEPCTHWGKTPPCVDTVLRSGLKRIVVSSYDPNPLVYKKGIEKIKAAGIELSLGLLQEKNKKLNETYFKYITKKIPFVTVKAALSLDGKTATRTFDSQWISSQETRDYIHLLRGEYDSIATGINTILKDDPRLTVRHPNWEGKAITRIVLDSHLRFPLQAKLLSTLSEGKILIFTLNEAKSAKADALRKQGAEIIPIPSDTGRIELETVLKQLGERGISSLLVEGGSALQTSFLDNKLVDKVILTISPKLIGGQDAAVFYHGQGADFIKDAHELKNISVFQIGDDILIEGYC
ncbi:MAG: bifunctional diaminohydroxyphosphoribosylaminopyrimidine deaminase/5-amino-6-(5-phosphoribosylamino)uracil reductase RibD [Candidatus Aminicenantes bacterium]|nr:bifunctional diaminohydroxyphosphoribosylaminopyrimidine deaminase/5-amino-6-(5-phosphoribosylamino)uracil reductase RibD [Candidatus Aminicenantes bacterium]